jgi:protein-tyrosine-phosphatase
MKKKNILVVCRGNIARSPIASELIKKEFIGRGIEKIYNVISRGVQGNRVDPELVMHTNIVHYPSIYKNVKPMLNKYAIDFSAHVSTPIGKIMILKTQT